MSNTARRAARGAVLVLALLALLSVPALASARRGGRGAARAASSRACRTAALDVWLDTSGNGAAGSTYYDLRFTNLGRTACALRGFPGVAAVELAGDRIGAAAARERGGAVSTRALAPGASATAVVRIVQAGDFPAAACREVTAAGLRVYPPGQRVSRFVPFPFAACSRAGAATLAVAPVGAR
jgi:hypothetical protein